MKRNRHGTPNPELGDISQSILLLTIRQAKMNSLIKSLIEVNKENNVEIRRLKKTVKRMG